VLTLGRNRGFDTDKVLDKAMLIFWENGYPGTSMADLTSTMGINKSSLYSAFGNKEKLYNAAIEAYLNKHGIVHLAQLHTKQGSLKERIGNYLRSIAMMLVAPQSPKGCFICHATSEVAGSCLPEISAENIKRINQQTLTALTDFFEKEQLSGNLAADYSPSIIANFLLTLQFGMAVSARNGASLDELKDTITFFIERF
jgi:AcrR family transcriptional regulator